MAISLQRVPGEYAVHRLAPDADIPAEAWDAPFVSIGRSRDELSIITGNGIRIESESKVGPWLAYRVPGAIDFSATGIMAALTAPLAEAGIGILGVSTYDTDYLLVHADAGGTPRELGCHAGIDVE